MCRDVGVRKVKRSFVPAALEIRSRTVISIRTLAHWLACVRLEMTVTRKSLAFGGASLLALIACAGWWFETRVPQDPERIATLYRDALLAGDADTVLKLAAPDEFKANGMTRDDVFKFLNAWVKPRILRKLDTSNSDVYGDGSSGFQTYSWGVVTRVGRLPITVSVAKTDEGLKVVQPLSSIVITFAGVHPNGQINHGGMDKLRAYIQNAPILEKELAPYHLSMIQLDPASDPMTIEQLGKWSQTRLEALQAHRVPFPS